MSFVVAIPSSGRAEMLKTHTLRALSEAQVNLSMVEVWVRQDELSVYQEEIGGLVRVRTHTQPLGLSYARNTIAASYGPGTRLVCADDDIKRISQQGACGNHRLPASWQLDFPAHVTELFRRAGGRLWGVNAHQKSNWMSLNYCESSGRIVPGSLFGFIVQHDPRTELVETNHREDVERTIKFLNRDGTTLMALFLGLDMADRRAQRAAGGLQQLRTEDLRAADNRRLALMFPARFQERPSGDSYQLRRVGRPILTSPSRRLWEGAPECTICPDDPQLRPYADETRRARRHNQLTD